MSGTSAAYFDYLPEYGKTLNHKLGRHVEIGKIDFWRKIVCLIMFGALIWLQVLYFEWRCGADERKRKRNFEKDQCVFK